MPTGYVVSTSDHFFIKVERSGIKLIKVIEESGEKKWEEVSSITNVTFEAGSSDANASVTVENEPGVSLPSTGGPGTNLLYILGSMLIMLSGAGFILLQRKKRVE